MHKGLKQLDERIPIEIGTIQVNFCKNPQCKNFGIPASTMRQPRGPGSTKRDRDTYTVVGSGRGSPMLRCSFCGQYPTIKSNKASIRVEPVLEVFRYHSYPDLPKSRLPEPLAGKTLDDKGKNGPNGQHREMAGPMITWGLPLQVALDQKIDAQSLSVPYRTW